MFCRDQSDSTSAVTVCQCAAAAATAFLLKNRSAAAGGLIIPDQAIFYSMAGKNGPTKVLLTEDEMPRKW